MHSRIASMLMVAVSAAACVATPSNTREVGSRVQLETTVQSQANDVAFLVDVDGHASQPKSFGVTSRPKSHGDRYAVVDVKITPRPREQTDVLQWRSFRVQPETNHPNRAPLRVRVTHTTRTHAVRFAHDSASSLLSASWHPGAMDVGASTAELALQGGILEILSPTGHRLPRVGTPGV
jgi:hypothetical protein